MLLRLERLGGVDAMGAGETGDTCDFSLLFFIVRVCYAIYVIVFVCIKMFVCRYFVCWVEFDEKMLDL